MRSNEKHSNSLTFKNSKNNHFKELTNISNKFLQQIHLTMHQIPRHTTSELATQKVFYFN